MSSILVGTITTVDAEEVSPQFFVQADPKGGTIKKVNVDCNLVPRLFIVHDTTVSYSTYYIP